MRFRVMSLFILLGLGACSAPDATESTQLMDVTTDYGFGRGYFAKEGDVVVRYLCPPRAIVLNRVNCHWGTQRLYHWGVQEWLRKHFGQQASEFERVVVQYLVKLDEIDARISMLLDVEPDHKPNLRPQIEQLRHKLAEIEGEILVFKDQKIQIKDQLDKNDDVDLRAQLDVIENALVKKAKEKDDITSTFLAVQAQYYDDNASIFTNETFIRLAKQRKLVVGKYQDARKNLDRELAEVTAIHTANNFLKDSSSWDFSNEEGDITAAVVNSIGDAFEQYFNEAATYTIDSTWSRDGDFQILANPVVDSFLEEITLWNESSHSCSYNFKSKNFNVTTQFKGTATAERHPVELGPLFLNPIDGHWIIHGSCGNQGEDARLFSIKYKL
jgi:hypothetical protein